MAKLAALRFTKLPFTLCLMLLAGCHHSPTGAEVFLQSEQALDKVQKFQMHIEVMSAESMVTDAKFACDQDVTWYETARRFANSPIRKSEFVQTTHFVFARNLAPEETDWSRTRRQIGPGVCDRLKTPSVQGVSSNRLITADQSKAVPPFFADANEQGATIAHDGDEVADGVPCEIWTIHHSASLDGPHSMWIGTTDRLPRKYVEGERQNPITVVTYTSYDEPFDIHLPPSDSGY